MTTDEKLDLLVLQMGSMDKRMSSMEMQMSSMNQAIILLREDVNVLKEDVGVLKGDVSVLKEDVSVLKEDVTVLKENVSALTDRVGGLEERVGSLEVHVDWLIQEAKEVKLIIENEIRPNISRVAEGHLDLARNLQAALKPNTEVEMLNIRMGMVEADVKELKKQVYARGKAGKPSSSLPVANVPFL
ncbi:MAG: hypothetical protein IJ833_01765 [Lachnospiraceae bacterium]|nr:hypothetical protein [Lachnospiraceae bacterium]